MAEDKEDVPSIEIIYSEHVEAMYFNGSLIQPGYNLRRLNSPKGRIYFIFGDEENESEPVFFGGTGMIGKELPTSEFLIQDISAKGYVVAKRNYYMRMLFGSFSHSRLADLMIFGRIHLDELPDMLKKYFYDSNFHITDKEHYDMSREAQKDMVALMQWVRDYEVELVFVEYPVYSTKTSMASQIDVGCFITTREGSGKNMIKRRVFVLVDYKSGKSGFFTEHKYQLWSNLAMFTERHSEFEQNNIELYNLSGKKWRSLSWGKLTKGGEPDRRFTPYSFVPQHNKIDVVDYNLRLQAAQNHLEERLNQPHIFIQGEATLSDNPKQFVVEKTFRQLIADGDWKRFLRTSAAIPETTI